MAATKPREVTEEEALFVGATGTEQTRRRPLTAEEGERLLDRLAEPPRKPTPTMLQAAANYKRMMSERRARR